MIGSKTQVLCFICKIVFSLRCLVLETAVCSALPTSVTQYLHIATYSRSTTNKILAENEEAYKDSPLQVIQFWWLLVY